MSTKLKPAAASAWIAGGTMAILGAPAALAQQQAAAPSSGQLEEVIVTAERRESSLQDTPIAPRSLQR